MQFPLHDLMHSTYHKTLGHYAYLLFSTKRAASCLFKQAFQGKKSSDGVNEDSQQYLINIKTGSLKLLFIQKSGKFLIIYFGFFNFETGSNFF